MKKVIALLFLTWTLLGGAAFAESVDINSADSEQLSQAISGVGPKRAAAIVAYREEHGPFKSVDELGKVKGIGPALIERNRENLTVRSQ